MARGCVDGCVRSDTVLATASKATPIACGRREEEGESKISRGQWQHSAGSSGTAKQSPSLHAAFSSSIRPHALLL